MTWISICKRTATGFFLLWTHILLVQGQEEILTGPFVILETISCDTIRAQDGNGTSVFIRISGICIPQSDAETRKIGAIKLAMLCPPMRSIYVSKNGEVDGVIVSNVAYMERRKPVEKYVFATESLQMRLIEEGFAIVGNNKNNGIWNDSSLAIAEKHELAGMQVQRGLWRYLRAKEDWK